jgi:hypothetical protein
MKDPLCQHKLSRIRELILVNRQDKLETHIDLSEHPLVCGIPKSLHEDDEYYSNFGHPFEGE